MARQHASHPRRLRRNQQASSAASVTHVYISILYLYIHTAALCAYISYRSYIDHTQITHKSHTNHTYTHCGIGYSDSGRCTRFPRSPAIRPSRLSAPSHSQQRIPYVLLRACDAATTPASRSMTPPPIPPKSLGIAHRTASSLWTRVCTTYIHTYVAVG
jgi:hypothetical protein